MNICKCNTCGKDLISWLYFNYELKVKAKQQIKDDQQSCRSTFVAYLTIPRCTSPGVTEVFHAWVYDRFIEIQRTTLGEGNFIELIKVPVFLEAVLAKDIM